MSDRPTILLPVRVLEGESLPEGVPALLAEAHVVLLGYHEIPEQTAPGQARMQFEERAIDRLDEFEGLLETAGATVERRLVFTHDGQQTIHRTINEHDCLAVLDPAATGAVEEILVAVRGMIGLERLARTVAGLFGTTDATITLYHVAESEGTEAEGKELLSKLGTALRDRGVDAERIFTRIEVDGDPATAIGDAGQSADVVVMGESDPSLTTFVFGMPSEQVAERFHGPVVVVQRERPEAD